MVANPQRVFISHIHEESRLAGVIRTWVIDAFAGKGVTAFVSSDRRDLPPGRRWLDVVRENLNGSRVLVAVLSPTALARPWPNIELGAGWIRDITVIPFCHSGIRCGELDRPFGDFHGIDIDNADPARDLLSGIADALGVEHPENLHFARFNAEMRAAIDAVAAAGSRHANAATVKATAVPGPDLPKEQIGILVVLAVADNAGYRDVEEVDILNETQIRPAAFRHHISELLHEHAFVVLNASMYEPTTYSLSPEGSKWLMDHDLMPE